MPRCRLLFVVILVGVLSACGGAASSSAPDATAAITPSPSAPGASASAFPFTVRDGFGLVVNQIGPADAVDENAAAFEDLVAGWSWAD